MAATMKTSLVCAITLIFTISISHAIEPNGFTVDLIHRDSLQSPSGSGLHSSSFESVAASLQRSFRRAKTLIPAYSSQQSVSADIVPDSGEYLMKFGIGTPSVETLAIADTGSDLTWIQCAPCRRCFKQKSPVFDPSRSSTYKPVPCDSASCNTVQSTFCANGGGGGGTCSYSVAYGDRSTSRGDVATETITLGSNASLPRVIIGCGHNDQGTFGGATSGIVGLGGGKESLIRQMGASIAGKFSYCLVPLEARARKASKMHFGGDAVVSGAGVVKTPIVAKSPDTFYYLTLEGMSVGRQRFDLASSTGGEKLSTEGNMIIDSGTTLTFLPSDLYRQVETALRRQVQLKEISDPEHELSLCYRATEGAEGKIPEITAHFRGGDVKLKPYNTFVMTSQSSLCFAFTESTSLAIYGNLAQMNFLIGYDLEGRTVSFKPTDCSLG